MSLLELKALRIALQQLYLASIPEILYQIVERKTWNSKPNKKARAQTFSNKTVSHACIGLHM